MLLQLQYYTILLQVHSVLIVLSVHRVCVLSGVHNESRGKKGRSGNRPRI